MNWRTGSVLALTFLGTTALWVSIIAALPEYVLLTLSYALLAAFTAVIFWLGARRPKPLAKPPISFPRPHN